MKKIKIESLGVVGQIYCRNENLKKILDDDFTYHYLPEIKMNLNNKADIFLEESPNIKEIFMEYPKISVPLTEDHRGLISVFDYLLERARQEKFGIYSLNSSSVQKDGKAIVFYGGATNLGKTSSALELSNKGYELFSDEKTLLDLKNQVLIGGSKSIALRKEILREKTKSTKEFEKFDKNSHKIPNIEMLILPHLDHGLKIPLSYKLEDMDSFWHLNKELTRRIRGDTKFFENYKYPLQSLDNDYLSKKRIELVKNLTKNIPTYYFQGNLDQLTQFVKEKI